MTPVFLFRKLTSTVLIDWIFHRTGRLRYYNKNCRWLWRKLWALVKSDLTLYLFVYLFPVAVILPFRSLNSSTLMLWCFLFIPRFHLYAVFYSGMVSSPPTMDLWGVSAREKLQMKVIWGAFDWFVALNFGGLGICQGLQ